VVAVLERPIPWQAGSRTRSLISGVINFLENTFRLWKVTLDIIALANPGQLNEASVTDAPMTPPMMGKRVSSTIGFGVSPRNRIEKRTEKRGSNALMVCVKDTATMPSETLVSKLPRVWTMARGSTATRVEREVSMRVPLAANHPKPNMEPRRNWYVVQVRG